MTTCLDVKSALVCLFFYVFVSGPAVSRIQHGRLVMPWENPQPSSAQLPSLLSRALALPDLDLGLGLRPQAAHTLLCTLPLSFLSSFDRHTALSGRHPLSLLSPVLLHTSSDLFASEPTFFNSRMCP